MDPAESHRVTVGPWWLQLPLERAPLPPAPSQPAESHRSPVNSPVVDDAYFSDIERVRRIGSGASGEVYEVIHRPSGRLHALKVISGHRHKGRPLCQPCHEIKFLRDVDEHPNVVGCRGVRVTDGVIQVLLDYVDGGSLEGAHIQDEQRLSRLAIQMLSGLAHLHERKVVHRELKPSNLLVNSRDDLRIADWIDRIIAESVDTWESFGRPVPYTSPERINPDLKLGHYDECAGDIWSIGLCILEIYQGRFPYSRGKQMEWLGLMFKIGNSEPPQAPSTASIELRDFIGCCLQKDPSKRWTAAQLLGHPFILQHNHGGRADAKFGEPPLAMAEAGSTKFDLNLNLSLGGLETTLSDSSFRPSDGENDERARTESNITDQSEKRDVSPLSDGDEKSDRVCLQFHVMHTKSSEGFDGESASVEVPTGGILQGWVDSFDGAEHRLKMKSVMNDQDQREHAGMLSQYQEDMPDGMLIRSTDHLELNPAIDIGMDHLEAEDEPCYTDPDTEDVAMVPAAHIHRMLKASESCHQIQTVTMPVQSSQGAALRGQCLPVEILVDAINGNKKGQQLRRCSQNDDSVSPDLFNQSTSEPVHSVEIQTMSKEQLAGPKSCLQSLDVLLPPQDQLKKGPWTSEEDQKLVDYIKKYGIWNWKYMPKAAGLNRSGKSCRLRWMNYLRPNIKRGKFSEEEEQVILRLHQALGNRWQAIAKSLPGRTDNEIKNFWNTHLKKRLRQTEKEQAMSQSTDAGNGS